MSAIHYELWRATPGGRAEFLGWYEYHELPGAVSLRIHSREGDLVELSVSDRAPVGAAFLQLLEQAFGSVANIYGVSIRARCAPT